MQYDISRRGVTVRFEAMPPVAVRKCLKAHGFRWSPRARLWYRRRVSGAAEAIGALEKLLHPDRPDGACWECGRPGTFRRRGAAAPVLCDHCA